MTSAITNRALTVRSTSVKAPCKAIASSNITLSGEQTIDSRAIVEDDRVLCSGQTDSAENGPWVCETSTWTRPVDFDNESEILSGVIIAVDNPSGSSGLYRMTYTGTITLGTTDITVTASNISVIDEDNFSSDSAVAPPSQQSTAVYVGATADTKIAASILDEDTMSSNSATKSSSQQALKAYVDTQITANTYAPSKPTATVHTTSTTHSFQAGTIWAWVRVIGAGGGGGGADATVANSGMGGAAGGYSEAIIDVDALGTKESTITIGSGGVGGATSVDGTAGTSSVYNDGTTTITCNGGDGGIENHDNSTVVNGGTATGGSINITGQGHWASNSAGQGHEDRGGETPLGFTSSVRAGLLTEKDALSGWGAGGASGAGNGTADQEAGGDGADGVVIIFEHS